MAEQEAIIQQVRTNLGRVDKIVAVVRIQREKLSEYRQALISAAVTGKIDVITEAA